MQMNKLFIQNSPPPSPQESRRSRRGIVGHCVPGHSPQSAAAATDTLT